jgi:hypothetical protein
MHTCLSLSNIGGHWFVERAISDLIARLDMYCDSIEWCNIAVDGPTGEGDARHWRVDLKLRVFDDIVRATTRLPEGANSAESLSRVLADVYARATAQLTHIAEQHHACCSQCAGYLARSTKACG